jgi:kinesin family protein 5
LIALAHHSYSIAHIPFALKQQGTFSEKDEQLRTILAKLDAIDNESGVSGLTVEDVTALRRQLHDGQNLIRETLDRLRQSQEESEMNARRRDEIETRFATLETEYEELIGESVDKRFPTAR